MTSNFWYSSLKESNSFLVFCHLMGMYILFVDPSVQIFKHQTGVRTDDNIICWKPKMSGLTFNLFLTVHLRPKMKPNILLHLDFEKRIGLDRAKYEWSK